MFSNEKSDENLDIMKLKSVRNNASSFEAANCLCKATDEDGINVNDVSRWKKSHSSSTEVGENLNESKKSEYQELSKHGAPRNLEVKGNSGTKYEPSETEKQLVDIQGFENEDEILESRDPGWDSAKNLSCDMERYKHVRAVWKSAKVPNPTKNLTFQSYRMYRIMSQKDSTLTQSTSTPEIKLTKRKRTGTVPCTITMDKQIDSLTRKFSMRNNEIEEIFDSKMRSINQKLRAQELELQNYFSRTSDSRNASHSKVSGLAEILAKSISLACECETTQSGLISELFTKKCQAVFEDSENLAVLAQAREEVLKFHSFYKGLNPENPSEDPTLITEKELRELQETEKMYVAYNIFYGD